MRWVIAGGRDYDDYDRLESVCRLLIRRGDTVVSGCARGCDTLGEKFADRVGCAVDRYPAEWDKYGKSAGHIRNHQMSQNADGLIAFWDGKSRGTKNMIENAHRARLTTMVVYYE